MEPHIRESEVAEHVPWLLDRRRIPNLTQANLRLLMRAGLVFTEGQKPDGTWVCLVTWTRRKIDGRGESLSGLTIARRKAVNALREKL